MCVRISEYRSIASLASRVFPPARNTSGSRLQVLCRGFGARDHLRRELRERPALRDVHGHPRPAHPTAAVLPYLDVRLRRPTSRSPERKFSIWDES